MAASERGLALLLERANAAFDDDDGPASDEPLSLLARAFDSALTDEIGDDLRTPSSPEEAHRIFCEAYGAKVAEAREIWVPHWARDCSAHLLRNVARSQRANDDLSLVFILASARAPA